jgi:hypothetical protein
MMEVKDNSSIAQYAKRQAKAKKTEMGKEEKENVPPTMYMSTKTWWG